jgi:hypothetical protein
MNDNWMCVVRQLSTQVELREFIRLWQLLREVSQSADVEDQILWKWMTNGEYTVNSAYSVQFQGSHPLFPYNKLWKAKTEPKVCWDRPSALAGINRRLLLGSTVGSCWDRPSELRSARTLNLTQQTEEEEDEQ